MTNPTETADMRWAFKRTNIDGTTRNGFQWPIHVGGWIEQDGPADGKPCGVGLHLAKTWRGASMGGHLAEAAAVVVGFLPGDVLGEDDHKIRVRRCYVAPGVTSFPQIIRNGWAAGANLTGAYLAGADLAGANLTGADLAGAYLTGADLTGAYLTGAYLTRAYLAGADLAGADLAGANLTGANLTGAYLTGATADRWTRWPAGFDPEGAGVNVR